MGIRHPRVDCMGVRHPPKNIVPLHGAGERVGADAKLGAQLDLHGQQLDEALAKLDAHLTRLGELCHPGGVLLQVLAACLAHSSHSEHATTRPACVECAVADRLVPVGLVQRLLETRSYDMTCCRGC